MISRRFPPKWSLMVALILLIGTTSTPSLAQNGYPNFGFRSYCPRSSGGIGGYPNQTSFNTGFSGLSETSAGTYYSTQRSTQAAENLAKEVSSIWTPMMKALTQQPQQAMANAKQSLSQPAPTMNGLLPAMSKQEMLRIFMEGGTPQSPGPSASAPSGQSSAATSTAYSNYQTATNEATKARNAAERVRGYDQDQWSRKNDASQAEYAANNADYAAQRAESAAYNAGSQAQGYANLAREAANRARADANNARYNADTMH